MTTVSYTEIELGNASVDISVSAEDEEVAQQMAVDLRDRAYRVSQALNVNGHPDNAEPHPVSMNWEQFVDGSGVDR